MTKNRIIWLNRILMGLIAIVALLSLFYTWQHPAQVLDLKFSVKKTQLPDEMFAASPAEYDRMGTTLLELKFAPMSLQLPDLRNVVAYYGRNERPDAGEGESFLHFALNGSKDMVSIAPGEPLYLVYDKDQPRIKYVFSPKNQETSLWLEAVPGEKEAVVNVAMRNEFGRVIRSPEKFAQFSLKEKPVIRYGAARWEIGKWKVDGTLLARQRARWYGKDVFLERHGGEEYKDKCDKQRIDFGEKEELYSLYLGEGECAVWMNGKWKPVAQGDHTQDYPLLFLNKVEERLLKFDLWDAGGKGRIALNVIKSVEPGSLQILEREFKFVGARTRSQLMFEVKGERILASPKDWYLFTENQWVRLSSPDDIDAYVDRKMTGPLFVIDEILRDDGKQLLVGLIYNTTRTDVKWVEIPLQQGAVPTVKGTPVFPSKEDSEDDDEESSYPYDAGVIDERHGQPMDAVKGRHRGKTPEEHIEKIKKLRSSIEEKKGQ